MLFFVGPQGPGKLRGTPGLLGALLQLCGGQCRRFEALRLFPRGFLRGLRGLQASATTKKSNFCSFLYFFVIFIVFNYFRLFTIIEYYLFLDK